jgi:hypothetical protein
MFAARMVVTIRFEAIIYSEFTPEKGSTIWSLKNGVFALKLIDQPVQFGVILSKLDNRLPPIEFLHKIKAESELIQA